VNYHGRLGQALQHMGVYTIRNTNGGTQYISAGGSLRETNINRPFVLIARYTEQENLFAQNMRMHYHGGNVWSISPIMASNGYTRRLTVASATVNSAVLSQNASGGAPNARQMFYISRRAAGGWHIRLNSHRNLALTRNGNGLRLETFNANNANQVWHFTLNVPYMAQNAHYNSLGWLWPVPGMHRISSNYGRRAPQGNASVWHWGVDIGSLPAREYRMITPQAGVVTSNRRYGARGYYIRVRTDQTAHNSSVHLEYIKQHNVGQARRNGTGYILVPNVSRVSQGESVARMGNSGTSYGIHLHFEVFAPNQLLGNDRLMNPLQFFRQHHWSFTNPYS